MSRCQSRELGDRKALPLTLWWKRTGTFASILPAQGLFHSILPSDDVWAEIPIIAVVNSKAAYSRVQCVPKQIVGLRQSDCSSFLPLRRGLYAPCGFLYCGFVKVIISNSITLIVSFIFSAVSLVGFSLSAGSCQSTYTRHPSSWNKFSNPRTILASSWLWHRKAVRTPSDRVSVRVLADFAKPERDQAERNVSIEIGTDNQSQFHLQLYRGRFSSSFSICKRILLAFAWVGDIRIAGSAPPPIQELIANNCMNLFERLFCGVFVYTVLFEATIEYCPRYSIFTIGTPIGRPKNDSWPFCFVLEGVSNTARSSAAGGHYEGFRNPFVMLK